MCLLENKTGYAGELYPSLDHAGTVALTAVLRGTFEIHEDGTTSASSEQEPVITTDIYHGEPCSSSVKVESDLAPMKIATDVIMSGTGYAPAERHCRHMRVSLQLGTLKKAIDVVGDRYWDGFGMSEPQPFLTMPLTYENAFGGSDPLGGSNCFFDKNPVGKGFSNSAHAGLALPNLEDPSNRIRSAKDRPFPQGFGFYGRNWQPRASLVGTMDEKWLRDQFPLPAADLDPRYFQAAHPDLISPTYLKGNEECVISGVTCGDPLRFWLPGTAIGIAVHRRRAAPLHCFAHLDTVLIRPDECKLSLTWRTRVECRRTHFEVDRIVAFPLRLDCLRNIRDFELVNLRA